MKHIAIFLISILCGITSEAQVRFGKYFYDNTLVLKYIISGDSANCRANFNKWEAYQYWTGARQNLDILPSPSDMSIIMSDSATGKVIYHNSYSSLFCEWQMMQFQNTSGDYKESVRMPMPKRPATVSLIRNYNSENKDTILTIDINSQTLPHPAQLAPKYKVENLHAAIVHRSINLVFLPEGYQADEMDKFLEAAKNMAKRLFEYEPFSHHYKDIAINAVLAPSPDSGIDIPDDYIERNSLMDFTYNTFGIDRYIGTRNHWAISDIASNTIWSHAIVLVNNGKYGGGGIYNFYSVFPANNSQILELFVHEFGHAFANLADEYAEPDNPIGQDQESGRRCIMHDLETKYYCDECKKNIEKIIKRR
ncbi:MAG: IgA Peptidase M64 [Bacteroidales bacterium]|nr:IgA Peptidase M64 [Bacteroidales bacterium]